MRTLSTLTLLILAASCSSDHKGEPDARTGHGRDVVLLTLDTTRYDHLGCYGYERDTSPVIDVLAREGLRFEVAYAAAPVTLPSHASILTGQHPVHHQVRSNGRYRLPDEARTLAQVLREAGYQSAAFLSAVVLDGRYGLGRGFDHYGDDLVSKEHAFAIERRDAQAVVDEALAWVDERDRDRPVFLWLHFFDPHHPWSPPPELLKEFGRRDVDLYDASIRSMDTAIGVLREGLSKQGIDPCWAILSDHGEGLSEHDEETHGSFAYDTTTRIAFVLSGAGFPARVSPAVARQIDLLPTVLDLLELPVHAGIDGRSLLRDLEGKAEQPPVYVEARLGYEEYGWSPVFGLIQDGWKYIEAPRPELYDLNADPGERNNLVATDRARAEAMKGRLAWYVEKDAEAGSDLNPDALHQRALEAIGYSGGGALTLPGEELPDPKDMRAVARKLSTAKSLLVAGPGRDPVRAFALFEEVLAENPANRDALLFLGKEAWREASQDPADPNHQKYIEHSTGAFRRIRQRAPQMPDGEFGMGILAMLRGEVDLAIVHYEAALQLDPQHVDSLENLMRVRLSRGEWARTIELSERILAIDERHHDALQYGGLAHFQAGAYAQAIDVLVRLLPARDAAERNGLHFVLGESQRHLGRFAEALTHYAKVQEPDRSAQGVGLLEEQCRRALESGSR